MIQTIDNLIALSVVASEILVVAYILALMVRRSEPNTPWIQKLSTWSLPIAFLTALGSMAGSLYYEFVHGFEPCILCWWLRIFIYPQVVILGLALWRRDACVRIYSIALSAIAVAISLYQSLLPILGDSFAPCSASGVSCAKLYVIYMGYITIPVMALSASLLMMLAMMLWKPSQN